MRVRLKRGLSPAQPEIAKRASSTLVFKKVNSEWQRYKIAEVGFRDGQNVGHILNETAHVSKSAKHGAPDAEDRRKVLMMRWPATVLAVLVLSPNTLVSASRAAKAHVETTDSESLWTGRFAHCDYGFYVLLPQEVVAHSSAPPNPIHEFLVALPDVVTRQDVTSGRTRYIWVNAEYDASNASSKAFTAVNWGRGVCSGRG
jgi:hypothetical protein